MVKRSFSERIEIEVNSLSIPSHMEQFIETPREGQGIPLKRRRFSPMSLESNSQSSQNTDYIQIPKINFNQELNDSSVDLSFRSQDSSYLELESSSQSSSSFVNSEEDRVEQSLRQLNVKCVKQITRLKQPSFHFSKWAASKQRAEVYDWLIHFMHDWKREHTTLFGKTEQYTISESTIQLSMEYLDRFFTTYNHPKYPNEHAITMLCLASFVLACKYNELDGFAPTEKEVLKYCDADDISLEDILKCESILLSALQWEMGDIVPFALAENYYNLLREYGIASLTLEEAWEKSITQTSVFLRYRYMNGDIMYIPNDLFTCSCILLSRLITLREMYPLHAEEKPIDMIQILGEDHVWPSCWRKILGYDLIAMKDCLNIVQKIYYRNIQSE